jgi:hypothetical protein
LLYSREFRIYWCKTRTIFASSEKFPFPELTVSLFSIFFFKHTVSVDLFDKFSILAHKKNTCCT